LAAMIADREAQLERMAGAAVRERRAAEEAAQREAQVRDAVESAARAREEAARESKAALEQVIRLQVELDALRSEAERTAGQARMREREVEAHVAQLERELTLALGHAQAAETQLAASGEANAHELEELKALLARTQAESKRGEDAIKTVARDLAEAA